MATGRKRKKKRLRWWEKWSIEIIPESPGEREGEKTKGKEGLPQEKGTPSLMDR